MTGNLILDTLISIGGIALVVAVVAALAGWRTAPLTEARVRAAIARDEPDVAIDDVFIDQENACALIADGAGMVFVVMALGDRATTRRARPGRARGAEDRIVIDFADVGAPRAQIVMRDADVRDRWLGRLSAEV